MRDDACVEIEESKNVSCWLSSSSVQLGPCPLIEVGLVIMDMCVCAALCAPHDGSPRDLWLCVLPRWQINVNVNVNAHC